MQSKNHRGRALENMKPIRVDSRQTYESWGHCIYCNVDGNQKKLTNEHIVPGGLDGRLELLGASCEACASITGQLEQVLLGSSFYSARLRLQMKSKKHGTKRDLVVVKRAASGLGETAIPIKIFPANVPLFEYASVPTALKGKWKDGKLEDKLTIISLMGKRFHV